MRSFFSSLLTVSLALAMPLHAEKLQQLLEDQGVPAASFSPEELSSEVSGVAKSDEHRTAIAYGEVDRVTGNALVGPRTVISFDKGTGAVQHKALPAEGTESCGGAPTAIDFADDFILLQTHINPSAACTLVVDANLALQKTLYGFNPVRVAPNQIVLTEDMIHFAPVHPERLQLVDLVKWTNSELYPPRGDLLRKNLAAKNAAGMPTQEACTANNESCDPQDFDESISALTSDGDGGFVFVASQEASHVRKEGEAPEKIASQNVLYVYRKQGTGWRYCQQELQESEVEAVKQQLLSAFEKGASRCVPRKIVFPDLQTQKYNPFVH